MPNLTESEATVIYRALLPDADVADRIKARALLDIADARDHNALTGADLSGMAPAEVVDCLDAHFCGPCGHQLPGHYSSCSQAAADAHYFPAPVGIRESNANGHTDRAIALDASVTTPFTE